MSLVDEYLAHREEDRKLRAPNTLFVTDLTKPCQLNAYLDIVEDRPAPPETLRIFEAGRLVEDWWVGILNQSKNIKVLGTQLTARYDGGDYTIHGRVDALCQHDNSRLVVHEVKSAKTAHWMKEPKPEHVEQLQFYLNALGVEWGVVDYCDKTVLLHGFDPRRPDEPATVDKSFTVQSDPNTYAELIKRARFLWECWAGRNMPDASRGWQCDYCLYHDICPEGGQTKLKEADAA